MADIPATIDELPPGGDRSHRFEVVLAVLLALAAVVAAYAAYRADLDRGDALRQFQVANRTTAEGNSILGQATAAQTLDQQIFVQYAKAANQGKVELAKALGGDLSPNLKKALDAWSNQKGGAASPFVGDNPTYEQPLFADGNAKLQQAQTQFAAANDLRRTADNFTLVTVFLASALFLYGIAAVSRNRRVRYGMTAVGALIFVGAAIGTAVIAAG